MIIEGKFKVNAPIQTLWETVMNPETLQECIPGAERIERLDDKRYECVVKQKVGPISVRFKFKSIITEVSAPYHVEMKGEGEDIGKAGRFTQKTTIDLREVGDNEVEVSYVCNANIAGKLAMFGDRILKAKAKKIEAEFTEALKKKLSLIAKP